MPENGDFFVIFSDFAENHEKSDTFPVRTRNLCQKSPSLPPISGSQLYGMAKNTICISDFPSPLYLWGFSQN